LAAHQQIPIAVTPHSNPLQRTVMRYHVRAAADPNGRRQMSAADSGLY
jgi:hypothetical protein